MAPLQLPIITVSQKEGLEIYLLESLTNAVLRSLQTQRELVKFGKQKRKRIYLVMVVARLLMKEKKNDGVIILR